MLYCTRTANEYHQFIIATEFVRISELHLLFPIHSIITIQLLFLFHQSITMSCCEALANKLCCCRWNQDDIFKSTPQKKRQPSQQNADSVKATTAHDQNDNGIINIDYPTQTSNMNRFDNQNGENKSQTDEVESKENKNPKHENTEETEDNPIVTFFTSIKDRFNEPNNNDKEATEEQSKAPEVKECAPLDDNVPSTNHIIRTQSKDDSFLAFFHASENLASHEKFEDDANNIVIEEKISEEKLDINIETTVQISPPRKLLVTTQTSSEPAKSITPTKNISGQQGRNENYTYSKKTSKNPKSIDELDQQILDQLAIDVPKSTNAERKRFLIARKGNYKGALDQLKAYIEWRQECKIDENEEDTDPLDLVKPTSFGSHTTNDSFISCASSTGAQDRSDWEDAAEAAVAYYNNNDDDQEKKSYHDDVQLPQLAHMVTEVRSETYLRDKKGNRILLLLPAQVNIDEVNEETYALAIGFYLDRKLDRNSTEKIVVAIDLRAGKKNQNDTLILSLICFVNHH